MQRQHELRQAFAVDVAPFRRPYLLIGILIAAALTLGASMPLPWHHHDLAGGGYTVVYGINGANWLLVVSLLLLVLAARVAVRYVSYYVISCLTIVTVLSLLGVYADYTDSYGRAAQVYVNPYYGPGFFTGLTGVLLLLPATVLVWRARP